MSATSSSHRPLPNGAALRGAPRLAVAFLGLGLLGLQPSAAAQSTLIVDPGGPYTTIQSALDAAVSGDTVLVSPGTYPETIDFLSKDVAVLASGPGGPSAHVIDAQGGGPVVTMQGAGVDAVLEGFTVTGGVGPPSFGTIGSSNIAGPGGILVEGGASPTIRDCHVVGNLGGDPGSGSLAIGGTGGMFVHAGSPTIERCEFRDNVGVSPQPFADCSVNVRGGAGGLLVEAPGVQVIDCLFTGNVGGEGLRKDFNPFGPCQPSVEASHGPGAVWILGSDAVVSGCTLVGNTGGGPGTGVDDLAPGGIQVGMILEPASIGMTSARIEDSSIAENSGGAIRLYRGDAAPQPLSTVSRCRITGNTGPTIYVGVGWPTLSPVTLEACELIGNSGGPAIYQSPLSSSRLIVADGCAIVGHTAGPTWGILGVGQHTQPTLTNSILWGCTGDVTPGGIAIESSCVQGGFPGPGNIHADPLFVQPPTPGLDGLWGTADDELGDLRLQPGSPCIDAGDNTLALAGFDTDLVGHWRFLDDPATPDTGVSGGVGGTAVADMGSYEFGALATDGAAVSISLGGASPLILDAGATYAGELYVITGSLSGTAPGTPAGFGAEVWPLNADAYFNYLLAAPGSVPVLGSLGVLDAEGQALAEFQLPPGVASPTLSGTVIHHAFAIVDLASGLAVPFISNAAPTPLAD